MSDRLRLLIASMLVAALAAGFWYSTSAGSADDGTVGGGELEAATAAIEAWGFFAATGDIGLVDRWFAADGPQYAQLQREVESITPGVYDFALEDGVVVEGGLVRGTVTITGGNGKSQTYRWDIELIRQGPHWKVWTVRTTPEEPRT